MLIEKIGWILKSAELLQNKTGKKVEQETDAKIENKIIARWSIWTRSINDHIKCEFSKHSNSNAQD